MPIFKVDQPIVLQEADGLWRDLRPNYEKIDIAKYLKFFIIPGEEKHGPQPYIMWDNGRKMRVRCEVILLDEHGRMLIKPNPGFKRLGEQYPYDCPGGGINKDESIEDAAARECKEEARIIPENIKFTGIHYTYEVPNDSKEHWGTWGHISFVCVAMKGDPYTGYVKPIDREESFIKKMTWIYPHEIDIIPAHEEAIRWYKQYYFNPIQEGVLPTLTFYHGSPVKYDQIKPTAFSAGNRFRDPSWSVFMFRQKELAQIFAFSRAAEKVCEERGIPHPRGWLEKDGFMHYKPIVVAPSDYYDKIKEAMFGVTVYVYTLEAPVDSNLNMIGTVGSLPEYVYSGTPKTVKVDEITIDGKLFEKLVTKISPEKFAEIKKTKPHRKNVVGPWIDLFVDMKRRKEMRDIVQQRLKDGTLKPGDNLDFLKEAAYLIGLSDSNVYALTGAQATHVYGGYSDMALGESQTISTDEYHINRFISGQDVYVNWEKWTSGLVDKCFIIGMSGSGKSTLSNKLAEQFHCYCVHTDRFRGNVHYTDEQLFKEDPIVYRYFDTVWGLKNRFKIKDMPKDQRTQEFEKFIDWVLKQNDRIIIEGAVEKILIKDPKLQQYPIVFKGTSMMKSMYRMVRRELIEKPTFEGAPISWILKFVTRYSDMKDLNNQARDSIMRHNPSYEKVHEATMPIFQWPPTHQQMCDIYDRQCMMESSESRPIHQSGNITQYREGAYFDEDTNMWMRHLYPWETNSSPNAPLTEEGMAILTESEQTTRRILLTSAGLESPIIRRLFTKHLGCPLKDAKVLFVTAAAIDKESKDMIPECREDLINAGIDSRHIVEYNFETHKTIEELNRYQAIYFCGGDENHLMRTIINRKMDQNLKEAVNSGLFYIGVSAGACIGSSYVKDGLRFIPHKVDVHYNPSESTKDGPLPSPDQQINLSNSQAVWIYGDDARIVGGNPSMVAESVEFKPMDTAPKPNQVYDPQLGMWIDPKKKDKDKYLGWFEADEKTWLKKVKFISDPNVRGGKPQPVIYDNKGRTFRPRCEVIVLDGYKVLIDPVKNRGNFHPPYSLPGGGIDGKEDIATGARRECEEEARIIPKHCVYTGIAWMLEFADPTFNQGSISFVCIAERGKEYKGYVKVEDRDPFADRAKWVDYRKFKLGEPHRIAIERFRDRQLKEEWIMDLDRSFLDAEYEAIDEDTGFIYQPVVFSGDDIYVNFDKFTSGEAKTCLITGLSGSGKSTLAKKIAEKMGAYYVATDVVSFGIVKKPENTNWDYVRENDKYLYKYFKKVGLKPEDMLKYPLEGDEKNVVITPYIKWLCLERDDDGLVVCEGGDVAIAIRDVPELSEMPIVFKGTSILKAMFRRFLRMAGKKGYAFAIKCVLQRYAPQYGKMIPEVRAARKTILGNHEYQTQHEAAGLRRIPTAEIEAFNDELNSFDYGILVNGQILTGNNIDFLKYRTISPEQLQRYKAGVCWDYVSYEYEWFKRHYPKQMRFTKDSFNLNTSQYSCYYMEHIDEDQDHPTHTWLAYTYGGNVYAFESAWKPIKGIHEFDSESTMVQWYLQQQQEQSKKDGNNLYGYVVIKYEPPSTYGMDPDEFMEYVHKNGKVVYTKNFHMSESVSPNNGYQDAKQVYDSLSDEDKRLCSPRGRYVDSPNLACRYVHRISNVPVGFIDCYKYNGKMDTAFILIAVDPHYRGQGIAKTMVENSIRTCRKIGFKKMMYRVEKENTASVRLAQSMGFEQTYETKNQITFTKPL